MIQINKELQTITFTYRFNFNIDFINTIIAEVGKVEAIELIAEGVKKEIKKSLTKGIDDLEQNNDFLKDIKAD